MKKIVVILIVMCLLGCQPQTSIVSNENSSIYYQIFVGSFYDSNEDGIGDLKGITAKLPYLNQLQIEGIWLTPIHPSDTYHKYDVKDYYEIDADFGTMEDFEQLIQEAEKYNIDIIIDLVLNHTSSEHPWFIEAKTQAMNYQCDSSDSKCDYYHFYSEAQNHTVKIQENLYYEAVFTDTMPDLNLDNSEVRAHIEDIATFWLDKGVAGFRLDAAMHYYAQSSKTNEFLSWFESMVKQVNPDAFLVGEVWSDAQTIYTHYESGIDSLFNFPASSTDGKIVTNIRNGNGESLATWFDNHDQELHTIDEDITDSIFISNHDQGRSGGFFKAFEEKQRLLIDVLLLSKGKIFLYYGEEIGMLGSGNDPNKRLPMLWGDKNEEGLCNYPPGSDYTNQIETSVQSQLEEDDAMLNHYLEAITLRNQYACFESGAITKLEVEDSALYAMLHESEDEKIIVLHNFSDQSVQYTIPYDYIKSDSLNDFEANKIENNIAKLAPYSSMVIQIGG